MGFWVFMFCCDLLIPLVMLFAGRMMQHHPPREINFVLGYRTARSMKNRETWVFAHRECGRLWQRWGWGELIATVVLMLLFLGEKRNPSAFSTGSFACCKSFRSWFPFLWWKRSCRRPLMKTVFAASEWRV